MRIIKQSIVLCLAAFMLSGCAEVISFAAGYGAGFATGWYVYGRDDGKKNNRANSMPPPMMGGASAQMNMQAPPAMGMPQNMQPPAAMPGGGYPPPSAMMGMGGGYPPTAPMMAQQQRNTSFGAPAPGFPPPQAMVMHQGRGDYAAMHAPPMGQGYPPPAPPAPPAMMGQPQVQQHYQPMGYQPTQAYAGFRVPNSGPQHSGFSPTQGTYPLPPAALTMH